MSLHRREEWDGFFPHDADRVLVQGLATQAAVGQDCWARQHAQPIEISLDLALASSFAPAAAHDQVDETTVHYGVLSKYILRAIKDLDGKSLSLEELEGLVEEGLVETVGNIRAIRAFKLEVFLPKASLLGAGVSYCAGTILGPEYRRLQYQYLHLRDIVVPTVVGVNDHEKRMKQRVVVNIWLDPILEDEAADRYGEVEQLVVKTIEEHTFETLEALATMVASYLIKYLVFAVFPRATVRLRLAKPSAIPFAAAPAVETVRRSDLEDPFARQLWQECGQVYPDPIPYPLNQRLTDYLSSQDNRRSTQEGSVDGKFPGDSE